MSTQYDTNTTADVVVKDLASHIKGKVVLTTGVSPGGLGAHFVEQIAAAQPKLLILAGRNAAKATATAKAVADKVSVPVETRSLTLDLSTLAGARAGAAELNGWADVAHVDVLVNNAGIMASDYGLTADGFESQFAIDHLAPFLFTNLIMPKLLAAPEPRVVSISSNGHRLSPMRWYDINFDGGKTYNKWRSYGQAKTANILFAISLAEKLGSKGLTAVSLHPGAIQLTSLGNHLDWSKDFATLQAADQDMGNMEGWWTEFPFKSLERGVATHVYAAFEPSLKAHNGAYCEDSHIADPFVDTVKPWATSPIEAERLWKLSEKLVGETFSY